MSPRAERRSQCPLHHALGVIGDRWTLLVLRDMVFAGKRHFRELLASPEGIASNILTDRLRLLESTGLITREPDPADRRQVIYSLTDKGRDLAPVMVELIRWSATHDPETAVSRDMLRRIEADRAAYLRELLGEGSGEK